MSKMITAAMLAIGDELLSGRTKDKNIAYLAEKLTEIGIHLKEVRIVADDENAIINAILALSHHYNYVFTSGGIGPTHDDITAQSIAKAFNLAFDYDSHAFTLLENFYASKGLEFNSSRQRMAKMPMGATHIPNKISTAPGFKIKNAFVMAGVPTIFEAMLSEVLPTLETGEKMHSVALPCPFTEGVIGTRLALIQQQHLEVMIGSYPKLVDDVFKVELIIRGTDCQKINAAANDIMALFQEMG